MTREQMAVAAERERFAARLDEVLELIVRHRVHKPEVIERLLREVKSDTLEGK